MNRWRAEAGLTLLEILVAMVILSIMLGVVYSSFFGTTKIFAVLESNEDVYQTAQTLLDMMGRELRSAVSLEGSNAELDDTAVDAISLVTTSHRRAGTDAREGYLAEISYFLDVDAETDERVLVKSVDTSHDGDPKSGGTLYVLSDQVESLNIFYYEKKEEEWLEEWSASEMPVVIRLELTLLDDRENRTVFRTLIQPPDLQ
jgi:prepilin-type N-terminal cleavage/methylation domain-containing protein